MKNNIVLPSWELVTQASTIKKFNFFPSFISTLYLTWVVFYQVAYTYIVVFNKKDEFFSLIVENKTYFWEIIAFIISWLILYLLLKPIAEAWCITLIDNFTKKEENKYRFSNWVASWLLNFLPLFEYHNFMWLFKLLSIVTFYFLLLRIFTMKFFAIISIIMFCYLIFAIVINVLFAYSKYFIIFEKKYVFEAISESTKMTLNNMEVTWKLYFTLFLVYGRIILTVFVLVLFAILFSTIFTYLPLSVSVIIFMVLGLFFLVLISHINSVLEIFVEALWYNAYMENKKNENSDNEKDS